MSEQPQGPVAPADARDEDVNNEGVHPVLVNPDQPVFPAPVGISREDLEEAGVAHAYSGVPDSHADEGEVFTQEEEGARPASEPEGKPADPDAEEKEKKLAEQAAAAQKASGQNPNQPVVNAPKPQGQGGQQGS